MIEELQKPVILDAGERKQNEASILPNLFKKDSFHLFDIDPLEVLPIIFFCFWGHAHPD